jgi:hypothetical protein
MLKSILLFEVLFFVFFVFRNKLVVVGVWRRVTDFCWQNFTRLTSLRILLKEGMLQCIFCANSVFKV